MKVDTKDFSVDRFHTILFILKKCFYFYFFFIRPDEKVPKVSVPRKLYYFYTSPVIIFIHNVVSTVLNYVQYTYPCRVFILKIMRTCIVFSTSKQNIVGTYCTLFTIKVLVVSQIYIYIKKNSYQ